MNRRKIPEWVIWSVYSLLLIVGAAALGWFIVELASGL